jgi:hypothetical protein
VLQLITDKFNDSIFSFIKEHWIMKDFNNDGFTDFKEIKSPLRQPWYEVFDIKSKKFKSNLLRGEIEEIKTGIFCDFPTTNKAGAEVISDLLYFKNGEAKILGRIYIEMGFKYSDVYKINADTTTAWNERINQRYHDSYFKNPKKDYDKIYDNFFVDYWKKNVNRFIRKKL